MFDKILEQSQNAFKPANELVALTTKAFEEAAEKQKSFLTDLANDNVAFVKELSAQKDFSGVYQTQKTYLQSVQDKLVAASTEAYETISSNQEKAGELFKAATAV
ncbi:MAG: phasin family protein [Agarilytica sp.]